MAGNGVEGKFKLSFEKLREATKGKKSDPDLKN